MDSDKFNVGGSIVTNEQSLNERRYFIDDIPSEFIYFSPVKHIKFNPNPTDKGLWNILKPLTVEKDSHRPMLEGMYFDKDNIVATDSHILLSLPLSPNKKYIGKILTPEREIVKNYPNYKVVIPDIADNEVFNIDLEKLLMAIQIVERIREEEFSKYIIISHKDREMVIIINPLKTLVTAILKTGVKYVNAFFKKTAYSLSLIMFTGDKNRIDLENNILAMIMGVYLNEGNPYSFRYDVISEELKDTNEGTLPINIDTKKPPKSEYGYLLDLSKSLEKNYFFVFRGVVHFTSLNIAYYKKTGLKNLADGYYNLYNLSQPSKAYIVYSSQLEEMDYKSNLEYPLLSEDNQPNKQLITKAKAINNAEEILTFLKNIKIKALPDGHILVTIKYHHKKLNIEISIHNSLNINIIIENELPVSKLDDETSIIFSSFSSITIDNKNNILNSLRLLINVISKDFSLYIDDVNKALIFDNGTDEILLKTLNHHLQPQPTPSQLLASNVDFIKDSSAFWKSIGRNKEERPVAELSELKSKYNYVKLFLLNKNQNAIFDIIKPHIKQRGKCKFYTAIYNSHLSYIKVFMFLSDTTLSPQENPRKAIKANNNDIENWFTEQLERIKKLEENLQNKQDQSKEIQRTFNEDIILELLDFNNINRISTKDDIRKNIEILKNTKPLPPYHYNSYIKNIFELDIETEREKLHILKQQRDNLKEDLKKLGEDKINVRKELKERGNNNFEINAHYKIRKMAKDEKRIKREIQQKKQDIYLQDLFVERAELVKKYLQEGSLETFDKNLKKAIENENAVWVELKKAEAREKDKNWYEKSDHKSLKRKLHKEEIDILRWSSSLCYALRDIKNISPLNHYKVIPLYKTFGINIFAYNEYERLQAFYDLFIEMRGNKMKHLAEHYITPEEKQELLKIENYTLRDIKQKEIAERISQKLIQTGVFKELADACLINY